MTTLSSTRPDARAGRTTIRPSAWSSLTQWILPLGLIALWQVLASAGAIPGRILPAPSDVVRAGWRLLLTGELIRNAARAR